MHWCSFIYLFQSFCNHLLCFFKFFVSCEHSSYFKVNTYLLLEIRVWKNVSLPGNLLDKINEMFVFTLDTASSLIACCAPARTVSSLWITDCIAMATWSTSGTIPTRTACGFKYHNMLFNKRFQVYLSW